MNSQILFSVKNKENINLSSAEFAHTVVKVQAPNIIRHHFKIFLLGFQEYKVGYFMRIIPKNIIKMKYQNYK